MARRRVCLAMCAVGTELLSDCAPEQRKNAPITHDWFSPRTKLASIKPTQNTAHTSNAVKRAFLRALSIYTQFTAVATVVAA